MSARRRYPSLEDLGGWAIIAYSFVIVGKAAPESFLHAQVPCSGLILSLYKAGLPLFLPAAGRLMPACILWLPTCEIADRPQNTSNPCSALLQCWKCWSSSPDGMTTDDIIPRCLHNIEGTSYSLARVPLPEKPSRRSRDPQDII